MSAARESLGLPVGSVVGDYRLEGVQGAWGFCLIYHATHTGTGAAASVHELLPEELVVRSDGGAVAGRSREAEEKLAWICERFLREGRGLAECSHPALQKILAAFEANGTAYWVTPREEDRNLKNWLQQLGRPPSAGELRRLLAPLLAGLEQAHAAGLFHLNLKPETILLNAAGNPRLIRFAGARQAIARYAHDSGAATAGYSSIEQYEVEKTEGPWTDIYSLGAVLHRAITGQAPPDASQRQQRDTYQRLTDRYSASYPVPMLAAIDAALAVEAADRPQSIEGWRAMLGMPKSGSRSLVSVLVCAAFVVLLLGICAWFLFPKPQPDHPDPEKLVKNEEAEEAKADVQKKAEEEQTAADKQTKEEEERKLAEEKAAQEKMAAQAVTTKAEAERKAAEEEAARLAKAAEAAAKAAEEAARKAAQETSAKKAEMEKAATQAAAEAAQKKAEAEAAMRAVQAKEEEIAKAKKVTDEQLADLAKTAEEAKRKAAADAEKMARQEAAARAEQQRQAAEKAAAQKMAAEQAAAEKAAKAKAQAEKMAPEKAAAEATKKMAAEKAAAEKTAAQKKAAEQVVTEKMLAERMAVQRVTAEEAERMGAVKATEENLAALKKAAAEKAAREKAQAEKAEAEKMAAEKAAAEEARRMAAEKAAAEMAAAQKMAAEKAAAERAAVAKAQAERAQAEKMAQQKAAAEEAGRMAAEKAAAERAAAEKAAAEKAAAEKMATNQKGDPNQGKYKKTGVENAPESEEEKNQGNKTGQGGSAVSGIPGVWETTAADPDGKPKRRLTIYDDGRYLITDNHGWKDVGVILANAGRIQMRSDATGDIVRSSFKLRSLSKIVTAGALGEDEWKRVSRSPGADPSQPKPPAP